MGQDIESGLAPRDKPLGRAVKQPLHVAVTPRFIKSQSPPAPTKIRIRQATSSMDVTLKDAVDRPEQAEK
jgi:hypothetical protein